MVKVVKFVLNHIMYQRTGYSYGNTINLLSVIVRLQMGTRIIMMLTISFCYRKFNYFSGFELLKFDIIVYIMLQVRNCKNIARSGIHFLTIQLVFNIISFYECNYTRHIHKVIVVCLYLNRFGMFLFL